MIPVGVPIVCPFSIYLPAFLCSTDITPFQSSYERSDFRRVEGLPCPMALWGRLVSWVAPHDARRISLLAVIDLPFVPSPNTPRCPWVDLFSARANHHLPWYPGVPGWMASWASPEPCRLATTTGRIEFVILRTKRSLPVALHLLLRERSYLLLMGSDLPMERLSRS